MNTKPNFFVVAGGRSGNVSMYNYFGEHPEVYMTEARAPGAFGIYKNSFSKKFNTPDKKAYLKLFKGTENFKIRGEISHYFYDEQAMKEIKEFNSDAKILIVIRNPIDLINSHYSNVTDLHTIGGDTIIKCLQTLSNHYQGILLRENLRYAHYIKLWQKVFGKKQVYIVIFNDLMHNLPREYSKICKWLGIDDKFQSKFVKYNPARWRRDEKKRQFVIRNVNRLSISLRIFLKKKLPKRFQENITKKLNAYFTIKEGTSKMDEKTKQYILRKYEPEIKALEKLLNKDLSKWRK